MGVDIYPDAYESLQYVRGPGGKEEDADVCPALPGMVYPIWEY
jgi:hypothetical protein